MADVEGNKGAVVAAATAKLAEAEEDTQYETRIRYSNAFVK